MPSRMEVNAAIEKLIARTEDSEAAAQTVILYGNGMKTSAVVQVDGTITRTNRDSDVSGYSPSHGNVTIRDEDKEESKEFTFGVYKDRVGHYRLWKEGPGLLCFQYFWKSGLATSGPATNGPSIYRLGYDECTFLPKFLGLERSRILLNLGRLQVYIKYLDPLLGTIEKSRIGFDLSVRLG